MSQRPASRAVGGRQGRRPGFSPANLSIPSGLASQPRSGGGGNPSDPGWVTPILTWDAVYRPAATALTASISNTNGTNTVEDMPGMPGVRAVKLKPNGQALYRGTLPSGSIDLSAVDSLYVYVIPRDTNTTSGTTQISIYLASDVGAITNRREYSFYLKGRAPGEGFVYSVPLNNAQVVTAGSGIDGWSAVSGTIDMAAVKTVAVQVKNVTSGNNSADNYFYVSDIFTTTNSRGPAIMLSWDKQFASVRDNALPLLDAAGIKCTINIAQFQIGAGGKMSLADLQTACANGHKVALHSYSKYLDLTDTANFPTAQSIADEIGGFETWAAANGLAYIPHHAVIAIANPWDASATYDPEVVAHDGYILGGLTSWREGAAGFAFRKLNHRLRGVTQRNIFTTPLAGANQTDIETLIQSAADRRGVLSLYSHECLASPGASDTTPTMVSAVIAKAAAVGIPFITPASW